MTFDEEQIIDLVAKSEVLRNAVGQLNKEIRRDPFAPNAPDLEAIARYLRHLGVKIVEEIYQAIIKETQHEPE